MSFDLKKTTQTAIVVVAKAPQVGKVKTRLCPPLTLEQAAALYTGFLLDTVEIALQVVDSAVLVVCPSFQDSLELSQLLPAKVGYIVQTGSGLSDALLVSFSQCLAMGYQNVLCISSDNPTLPQVYLEEAIEKLDHSELVLGPSEDGGYYLIGAQSVYPTLFKDMIWSTSTVLVETLTRAEQASLRTALLPLWYDLDTGQELARFMLELPLVGEDARHTRTALKKIEVVLGST